MMPYFSRLASRTGLSVSLKHASEANASSAKQVSSPGFSEFSKETSLEKTATPSDIEIHEEKTSLSSSTTTEGSVNQETQTPISAIATTLKPEFKNVAQPTLPSSSGEPPKHSPMTETTSSHSDSVEVPPVLAQSTQAQNLRSEIVPPINTASQQITQKKSLEIPRGKNGPRIQSRPNIRENVENQSGFAVADLRRNVGMQTLPQSAETEKTLNKAHAGRSIEQSSPRQLNRPSLESEQSRTQISPAITDAKKPATKQVRFKPQETARPFSVVQAIEQVSAVNTPRSSKNQIEIKIGKITLEIHQALPPVAPTAPAPMPKQQNEAAQGNHLSRYYLREF